MMNKELDRELKQEELDDVQGGVNTPVIDTRVPVLTNGVAGSVAGVQKDVPESGLPGHMRVPPKAGVL